MSSVVSKLEGIVTEIAPPAVLTAPVAIGWWW